MFGGGSSGFGGGGGSSGFGSGGGGGKNPFGGASTGAAFGSTGAAFGAAPATSGSGFGAAFPGAQFGASNSSSTRASTSVNSPFSQPAKATTTTASTASSPFATPAAAPASAPSAPRANPTFSYGTTLSNTSAASPFANAAMPIPSPVFGGTPSSAFGGAAATAAKPAGAFQSAFGSVSAKPAQSTASASAFQSAFTAPAPQPKPNPPSAFGGFSSTTTTTTSAFSKPSAFESAFGSPGRANEAKPAAPSSAPSNRSPFESAFATQKPAAASDKSASLVTKSDAVSALPMDKAPAATVSSSAPVKADAPPSTRPLPSASVFTAPAAPASAITVSDTATGHTKTSTTSVPQPAPAPTTSAAASASHVMVMTQGTSPPFKFCPSPLSGDAAATAASWTMPDSTDAAPKTTTTNTTAAATPAASSSAAVASTTTSKSARPTLEPSVTGDIWVCQVCEKTKALSGAHLDGKSTVRSDCWPCGKKRTFVRTTAAALRATRGAVKSGSPSAEGTTSGDTAAAKLPINKDDDGTSASTANAAGAAGALASKDATKSTSSSSAVLSAQGASMWFDKELLRAYRHRLVAGIPLRCVWRDRVLYVIAPDIPNAVYDASASAFRFPFAGEVPSAALPTGCDAGNAQAVAQVNMGRYAALFMAIDHKVASSKFNRLGRIFCANAFSYAAACTYADRFACSPENMPAVSTFGSDEYVGKFKVYGPAKDPTAGPSVWNSIVEYCPYSVSKVVSGDQRIEAAKKVYQRTSWMVLPENTTAAALYDLVVSESNEPPFAHPLSADVVLLPETMKLEDLHRFSTLTQI